MNVQRKSIEMATIDVSAKTRPALIADLIRGNIAEITRVMRAARGGLDEWGLPYPSEAEGATP